MTYDEARNYAAQIAKSGSVMGLASIKSLMYELSDIQENLSVIHIAGTNGKGSVGAFLASVLREDGHVVGRYTSPAVFEPLEVWQINGTNISKEDYAAMFSRVRHACENMVAKGMPHPTVFEVETAVAFLYFYEKKCDYVLLETGMGGKTDATNLITHPLCAVITSVSMDHMQFLGNTLGEIAKAKAGIIKENCPVVTIRQKREAMEVITKTAQAKQAPLFVADKDMLARNIQMSLEACSYDYVGLGRVTIHMTGAYQMENSLLAACVAKEVLHIPAQSIQNGLNKARWSGRFEILQRDPLFIIDGAHNEDAAEKLYATLQNYFTNRKITYIIGVLADKEHKKMLKKMLPMAKRVYTVTPKNPRALPAEKLADEARQLTDAQVHAANSVSEALWCALSEASQEDLILAFGSLSYLGELRHAWEEYPKEGQTQRGVVIDDRQGKD
jgi:dihydrofolate synthase/folylpolyglutamate synthase